MPDNIPSVKSVFDFVNEKDYTAFEVYPTYDVISAGTVSDVRTIVGAYSTNTAYNEGGIVERN